MESQAKKQEKIFMIVSYDNYQDVVKWMQSEGYDGLVELRTPYIIFNNPLGCQVAKIGDVILQTKKGLTPIFEAISNTDYVPTSVILNKVQNLLNET